MPSIGNFLHTQLILNIPIPITSFASKTVKITGASSALGQEAAKHIVRLGASKVILACRNTTKGNETKHEIETAIKCNKDIIEVWQVNIESADSLKQFVDRANKLSRWDVVINNVGLAAHEFHVYSTERTLAVNVVGTFLLGSTAYFQIEGDCKDVRKHAAYDICGFGIVRCSQISREPWR